MLDWNRIDTVLLDMDGTLLDLHFDNYFWLEHVPVRYAEARGLSVDAAKAELMRRYADIQGTLQWYCVDHWSRELGLDIALLKQEVDHLIAVHPHVVDFLGLLSRAGKRRVLVTNAHQKSLELKMRRTQLRDLLDHVVCAHDLGVPKEDAAFWPHLQREEPFDPGRVLFVDDSVAVLRSARRFGIARLLAIALPDTRQGERPVDEFPAVRGFSALLPGLREHLAQRG
ncbi:MAG: GMP/IMP nucleotidase [Chromatiaceae bacterium]|nr:GMP/IMP nucleotidase [Gammaproteobacteria bacterium]MCP5305339.1 GMP/IMP nucleotidase [Chromatiaceae bacterium]MCP5315298.1 GMP/IMP nucleotidase [Chromatiaceae bacterium]